MLPENEFERPHVPYWRRLLRFTWGLAFTRSGYGNGWAFLGRIAIPVFTAITPVIWKYFVVRGAEFQMAPVLIASIAFAPIIFFVALFLVSLPFAPAKMEASEIERSERAINREKERANEERMRADAAVAKLRTESESQWRQAIGDLKGLTTQCENYIADIHSQLVSERQKQVWLPRWEADVRAALRNYCDVLHFGEAEFSADVESKVILIMCPNQAAYLVKRCEFLVSVLRGLLIREEDHLQSSATTSSKSQI